MVDQITERLRHHTLNDTNQAAASQHGVYRPTGRGESCSPVVTIAHPTLVRGRSLDEATPSNMFSIRQSQTPPSLRSLDTPISPRPQCQHCVGDIPPYKRHCRSLSIPNTGRGICHHLAANLYRPVALRPASAVTKSKNRHSPLNYTRSHGSLQYHYHQGVTSPNVHRSSSEFSSPPDSPVPRPASVSSGYYDSSMSSLAGLPWLECQFSPTIFQKSLSMEEAISGFSSQGAAAPASFSPPSGGGKHQKIPRCRSQPCVLTKSGTKRRREEIPRPSLDFHKMKETAYHHFRRRAHSASHPKDIRSPRFVSDDENVFGLKPILGSPLDGHHTRTTPKLAHIAVSPSTSPTQEVDEEVEGINFSKLSGADSGCSADGDEPAQFVEYPDISDYSPCTNIQTQNDDAIFPLDELDLEQIEND